ncbi:MAG: DinB family protein [Candidatus Promineifilaceae bacterium]|nr:DinB family protein [Candidatus Promineifilaceae bacterium]
MNTFMREQFPMFEAYQALRNQLMEVLTDDDLAFSPGGGNLTLGELCREIGETERSYIDSLKSLKQDFSYRNDEPGLDQSVAKLNSWYRALDQDLKSTLESFSDQDMQDRIVDRGGGFELPIWLQVEVYKEALLIFYGKTDVYLKTRGITRSQQWQDWIA